MLEAARPLDGVRVLHVTVAGAQGRVSEMLRRPPALEAGAGVQVEWGVLFGDPELRRVANALHAGLRGGESAIGDADGRPTSTPAGASPWNSRATTWWCCTTRARSAWRPRWARAPCGTAT